MEKAIPQGVSIEFKGKTLILAEFMVEGEKFPRIEHGIQKILQFYGNSRL